MALSGMGFTKMSDEKSVNPEAQAAIAKVRRLMLIAGATTFIALAFVLGVIGYRVFRSEGSAPAFADVTAALPAGAKVLSTAVSNDHIVVTIEVAGSVDVLTFDPDTLKPLGRLRLKAP
jgi:hypothetical protein